MNGLGIVVIGRNEGERLVRCLHSIARNINIVYVDSGSTDGSIAEARARNASVVELDMSEPFTAARARNAGRAALPSECSVVQFIDGDCTLRPGWLEVAHATLLNQPRVAAVFGRRREVAPGASRYNWMCDVEWAVPPGPSQYFGGDVMLRCTALDAAGGYPDGMIAGEEPDLAIRLRARGWTILCLPLEMTLHDAAIMRFGQWWRRATRSGHAYAELAARNLGGEFSDYGKRLIGVIFWGGVLPIFGAVVSLLGAASTNRFIAVFGGVLLMLPLAQFARLAMRDWRRRRLAEAVTIAAFIMLAKPAQMSGAIRYWVSSMRGRRTSIIEYKGGPA